MSIAKEEITIFEAFENVASKYPHYIAICDKDNKYTYKEFLERVYQMQNLLLRNHITHKRIGIFMDESYEMMIAILGSLSACNTIIPIDVDSGYDRINYIIKDSSIDAVIHNEDNEIKIESEKNIKMLSLSLENLGENGSFKSDIKISSDSLAYIIYTSGTTGRPKGVPIKHISILNSLNWRKKEYNFANNDTILQLLSFSFDGFFLSSLTPLVSGSKLILTNNLEKKDPEAIIELINTYQVNHFICVPSIFENILDFCKEGDLSSIDSVTLAGEKTNINVFNLYDKLDLNFELTNEYGPTENSVVSTIKRNFNKQSINSIGHSIDNVCVEVLDTAYQKLGMFELGEIVLSGIGLTPGYINNETLNKENFFVSENGTLKYLTGDIGFINANGDIEYVGRKDEQIKLRGYRVELEEIEGALLSIKGISRAVVIIKQINDNPSLVGYFCLKDSNINYDRKDINSYLSSRLPKYMIPTYLCLIPEIPYLSNGKVDKRALPIPKREDLNFFEEYQEAENHIEKDLIELWRSVLGIEEIGRNDNFFSLGGTSLSAISMLGKIREGYKGSITIKDIYENPTVKELANKLSYSSSNSVNYSIISGERKKRYELGASQKTIWFMEKLGNKKAYAIPILVEFDKVMEESFVKNAIYKLINKHKILSAKLVDVQGIPHLEEVSEVDLVKVRYLENDNHHKNEISRILGKEKDNNLIEFSILQSSKQTRILIVVDHIIFDGHSSRIFIEELVSIYEGLSRRENIVINDRLQYEDYIEWQKHFERTIEYKKQLNFWKNKLKENIQPLNFPFYSSSPESSQAKRLEFTLNPEAYKKLSFLTQKYKTTTFTIILTALNILFHKITGQLNINIGTPVSNRDIVGTENLIGLFINTVVLPTKIDTNSTVQKYIDEIHLLVKESLENSKIPFEKLVKEINPIRTNSNNPFFNVFFSLQENYITKENNEFAVSSMEIPNNEEKFDLSIFAEPIKDGLNLNFNFKLSTFDDKHIHFIYDHLLKVIDAMNEPLCVLNEVDLETVQDKELWSKFNNTDRKNSITSNSNIIEPFEKIAKTKPNSVALIYEDRNYTYEYLNKNANKLANYLLLSEIKPDESNQNVGILMERSPEMIISLLALLKLGYTYVPLDVDSPEERLRFILEETKTALILRNKKTNFHILNEFECLIVDENETKKEINSMEEDLNEFTQAKKNNDIAYITYTSGTTGTPKGVKSSKVGIINYLQFIKEQYSITENDVVLQIANVAFDASTRDIFGSLLSGAKLILLNNSEIKDADQILMMIKRYQVNKILSLVPSVLRYLISRAETINFTYDGVKLILLSGEVLYWEDIKQIRKYFGKQVEVANQYGPTECIMTSSFYKIEPNKKITKLSGKVPIGKPIYNRKIYVMNKEGTICPPGIPGEIYVTGDGLSSGYVNNIVLTNKSFIYNPLVTTRKLYRTRDLGVLNDNGYLKLIGRLDNQIKINGILVEPSEIEETIKEYPSIVSAFVQPVNKSLKRISLNAFLKTEENKSINKKLILKFLKSKLPEYMIPTNIYVLENIPTLPNGKVDRVNLINHSFLLDNEEVQKLDNMNKDLVEMLIDVWRDVIGIKIIEMKDNFFRLGGHSLMIVQLILAIKNKLQVEITISDVFQNPDFVDFYMLIENKLQAQKTPSRNQIIKKINRNSLLKNNGGSYND